MCNQFDTNRLAIGVYDYCKLLRQYNALGASPNDVGWSAKTRHAVPLYGMNPSEGLLKNDYDRNIHSSSRPH